MRRCSICARDDIGAINEKLEERARLLLICPYCDREFELPEAINAHRKTCRPLPPGVYGRTYGEIAGMFGLVRTTLIDHDKRCRGQPIHHKHDGNRVVVFEDSGTPETPAVTFDDIATELAKFRQRMPAGGCVCRGPADTAGYCMRCGNPKMIVHRRD